MKDPRYKNIFFRSSSVGEYYSDYKKALLEAAESVDVQQMDSLVQLLKNTILTKKTVLVAGNGGSASIADQLATDWTKGTFVPGRLPLKTRSLCANNSVITALGNDMGYEEIFTKQIEMLAEPGDVVMFVSSSGNSPNVVKAARYAKELGLKTIAFTGFSGGELAKSVDVPVHVNFSNYGIVEDIHQGLMHAVAQYISIWIEKSSECKI